MKLKLGQIVIDNQNPLVIPEIGINHNGELGVAFEMVDSAQRAGAKIVKFQSHVIDDEMSGVAKKIIPGNADISIYEIMKSCALSESEEIQLKKYVEEKNMMFLSTPFSRAAANRLERMGVEAYKIGSGELNNYPLIEHIASFGKPIILSTGMNDIESVRKAVNIIRKYSCEFALLHTTNLYPTPSRLVRLGGMQKLMSEFPDVNVGLSDHTINNNSAIAALALGATIIERHYTDHKKRKGPDIICSMDEEELRQLIDATLEVPLMLGGDKQAAPEEQVTIDFAFATVVAIEDIEEGEELTTKNIWVKRPGTGEIKAEFYYDLIGKKTKCKMVKDTHLSFDMIGKNE